MVSKLQRALALWVVVTGLCLAWWGGVQPRPMGWHGLWLALLLVPQAPVLALEFVLLAWFGRDPLVRRPRAAQLVGAWWAEVWCSWRVFGWRQPFLAGRWPDVPGVAGRRGVVLVHGFFCNRGLWNPWLKSWSAQATPCTALTLEPAFGAIDGYSGAINAAVQQMYRQTGLAPVIVAHSMGGLAVRCWLAERESAAVAPAPVHAVLTVGTPHRGTWLARFALTRNGQQMRLGSPWLRDLAAREQALDRRRRAAGRAGIRFICFYGHADNIVFPASRGMLAGADNRHLPGAAHVQMLFLPEVWAAVNGVLHEPARM